MPQKTGSLIVRDKPDLKTIPAIEAVLGRLRGEMGDGGRVLLRYSGTEPKIRLLIEGESIEKVDRWYQSLEYEIKKHLI